MSSSDLPVANSEEACESDECSVSPTPRGRSRTRRDTLFPELPKPDFIPEYVRFHHITFYVGCVETTAKFLVSQFGFIPFGYKGLETGSRYIAGKILMNGGVAIELLAPLKPSVEDDSDIMTKFQLEEIHRHLKLHGDSVKDVAFVVEDCDKAYEFAVRHGDALPLDPVVEHFDECGRVCKIARLGCLGTDVTHTIIQRDEKFYGFLPDYLHYEPGMYPLPQGDYAPIQFSHIDHVVQNCDWDHMQELCDFYRNAFGFHQFWSVDESQVSTEYSALRSTVMSSKNDVIKMPVNEPANGLCKSQIEEFVEFYVGQGVQHIALNVENIIGTVISMKQRGVAFVTTSESYYDLLAKKLEGFGLELDEPFQAIRELGILVDCDEKGYLLQIFTKSVFDRPTVFFEIIQRHNHNGFGAGNFKSLFEALEVDQMRRGNLSFKLDLKDNPSKSSETPETATDETEDEIPGFSKTPLAS